MRVFLVRRNPEPRFMGGYWAFSGGMIMQEDYRNGAADLELAHVRCVLRELFEETGILISTMGMILSNAERREIRQQLLESSTVKCWLSLVNSAATNKCGGGIKTVYCVDQPAGVIL